MRSEFKICIIVLASIAIGAVGSWFLFGRPAGAVESQSEVHGQRLAKSSRSGSVKKVTEISVDRKTGEMEEIHLLDKYKNSLGHRKTFRYSNDEAV